MFEFDASNAEWVDQVCARPPPRDEQVEVIIKKSRDEIDAGLLRGYWTRQQMDRRLGRGRWRPLVRFAVWQAGAQKYRVIDNGRTAGHNYTLSTCERIHTASIESGAAMIRRLRQLLDKPLSGPLAVRSSTQDMQRAFRQLGVRDHERRYHIIAIYMPKEG